MCVRHAVGGGGDQPLVVCRQGCRAGPQMTRLEVVPHGRVHRIVTPLTPRSVRLSGYTIHRSPRRGGLDDPRSPGNTALGAVRKCGSGRSLGRDRQVNSVRGCVGLLAESDLTPTPERRHRGNAPRRRALLGHIGSGGIQRQLSGGDAGTTQSMFTPLPADPAQEGCSPFIRAFTQPSTPPHVYHRNGS